MSRFFENELNKADQKRRVAFSSERTDFFRKYPDDLTVAETEDPYCSGCHVCVSWKQLKYASHHGRDGDWYVGCVQLHTYNSLFKKNVPALVLPYKEVGKSAVSYSELKLLKYVDASVVSTIHGFKEHIFHEESRVWDPVVTAAELKVTKTLKKLNGGCHLSREGDRIYLRPENSEIVVLALDAGGKGTWRYFNSEVDCVPKDADFLCWYWVESVVKKFRETYYARHCNNNWIADMLAVTIEKKEDTYNFLLPK
jgi:hypothetical protein